MMLKIITLSTLTIINYNIIDFIPLSFIKAFAFLFIQILILFIYLSNADERQIEYRRVCWENYQLYNRNTSLEERILELRKTLHKVEEEMVEKVSKYQRSIGMCGFPYCKKEESPLCNFHSRFKREECGICYEKFNEGYFPLSCGHFLHQECLKNSGTTKCCYCKKDNKYQ